MQLTPKQRRVIDQVVNVFETSTPAGDYANISIFADGPGDVRQITYGRSQTTEYSKLRDLIERYVLAGGLYGNQLAPYVTRIGSEPLVDDEAFKDLLRQAGQEDRACGACRMGSSTSATSNRPWPGPTKTA